MPFDSAGFAKQDQVIPETPYSCPEIEILDGMAELLATPDKWCQGDYQIGDGYCLLGAFRAAVKGDYNTSTSYVLNHLVWYSGGDHISRFNDDPATTHTDILNLISKTRASFVTDAA
jgi:hypothetical protein